MAFGDRWWVTFVISCYHDEYPYIGLYSVLTLSHPVFIANDLSSSCPGCRVCILFANYDRCEAGPSLLLGPRRKEHDLNSIKTFQSRGAAAFLYCDSFDDRVSGINPRLGEEAPNR